MNINECSIRRATIDDMLLYFEWANDPDVRQNSFNQNPITLEEHEQWFQKKVLSSTSYLYVLECGGKPAGQIRFDEIEPHTFEIDFTIAPDMRGYGIGIQLLKLGILELANVIDTQFIVRGIVKNTNIASVKSFLRAGFITIEENSSAHSTKYELCISHTVKIHQF